MEILDGDRAGLDGAVGMVMANPNPRHLDEDRILTGASRGIQSMLGDSLAASAVAGYSVRKGEAIVGGVTLMPARTMLTHMLWMLTTAGAPEFPRWLVREGRRMLAAADRVFRFPFGYVQGMPASYPEGLNYARHMGFSEVDRIQVPADEIVVFERMIPPWAQ